MTNYNYVISDLPIYKAALLDNWDSVSQLFEQDPELLTKQITYWWETPLIIAVGTNRSHSFVEKLVERIVGSYGGNNPLHYAAKVGNTTAAKLLVEQNPDMTRVPNPYGNTPLKLAAWHGNKDTLKYLLTVTPDTSLPGEEGSSPYTGVAGGDLITLTIMAGFYGKSDMLRQVHDTKQYHHLVSVFSVLSFGLRIFCSNKKDGLEIINLGIKLFVSQ
ncbi:putative ankyrin repeat-containing domain-containing protein [Helianthus annuus]|nr:putative ankyrin repeat-containing domain-containing protein [Helianthus annuus]